MVADTRVDPRGPRFSAWVTSAVLAVVLITGSWWLLAVQAVIFAVSAYDLSLSPYGLLYRKLVRPRLGPPEDLEETSPLRFAQAVGLVFAVVGVLGYGTGLTALGVVAAAAALVAAFLNAAFGFCLGCQMYLLIRRVSPASR